MCVKIILIYVKGKVKIDKIILLQLFHSFTFRPIASRHSTMSKKCKSVKLIKPKFYGLHLIFRARIFTKQNRNQASFRVIKFYIYGNGLTNLLSF
jgi:hypothetical protein